MRGARVRGLLRLEHAWIESGFLAANVRLAAFGALARASSSVGGCSRLPWRRDGRGGNVTFDGLDTSISRRLLLQAGGAIALASALLPAKPSFAATSNPEARRFDFLHGRWNVTHRKLKERLAGSNDWIEFPGTLTVAPILGGLGNFDENVLHDPKGDYQASSLRLFNPGTQRWSIWWFDSRFPGVEPPVVGGFRAHKGTFYVNDVFNGRPIRVRTTYEPLTPDHAQWTQAFSADAGTSWETNWIMDFKRSHA